VSEKLFTKTLSNGLTLLGQQMPQVASAALALSIPSGAAHDPPQLAGAAAVAAEWRLRGAGDRDTRQLHDALDALGCQHGESVLGEHVQFTAAQLGRNLADVMDILGDIARRPRLADETFAPCRALVQQDLASLEDEPARKCNLLLRERFYPYPLGRCIYGSAESLAQMDPAAVRSHMQKAFGPAHAMLAVAGNVDWERFCDDAERVFGDWESQEYKPINPRPARPDVTHVRKESAQVHIALAHKAAPVCDADYYAARLAQTVLSGGMSSRLFTEVREKRGLVYHVSSRYHSLKTCAGMFTYAGTTPEKAQQTLEVTAGELRRLAEGVDDEEMTRARTQLKSGLVMQGESTQARSAALAGDWYHLGRLRTLDEIATAIDRVSRDEVLAYLRRFPAESFTVLYIGPNTLNTAGLTGDEA